MMSIPGKRAAAETAAVTPCCSLVNFASSETAAFAKPPNAWRIVSGEAVGVATDVHDAAVVFNVAPM